MRDLNHKMSDREKCQFYGADTVEISNGCHTGSTECEPLKGSGCTVIRSFALAVSLLLLIITTASVAFAENVRGRIIRQDYYGYQSPLPNISVTLRSNRYGRSPSVYTNLDGMYYINNIPPGEYLLELWVYPRQNPVTREIFIPPGQYITNLPPYVVR